MTPSFKAIVFYPEKTVARWFDDRLTALKAADREAINHECTAIVLRDEEEIYRVEVKPTP